MRLSHTLIVPSVFLCAGIAVAQATPTSSTPQQSPKSVTMCQLAKDPAAYNHAMVRISGTASQGFEDFTLHDPKCHPPSADDFSVWLAYGGTVKSGTIYCCPGEGEKRQRTQPVEIEGVSVPLVNDAPLHRFMSALRRKPHTARTTLIGVFFAGQRQQREGKPTLPGYGHLGCCSLLVIEKVESVSDVN